MNLRERMEAALNQTFKISELQVVDQSDQHRGHTFASEGGETHFSVVIVSNDFQNKSKIARHQMVYAALGNLMKEIHALQLQTVTLEEFQASKK